MVKRLSVSIDDELADWVETQASDRGISQAKVVRDALTTERDRLDGSESADLTDRMRQFESRLVELERALQPSSGSGEVATTPTTDGSTDETERSRDDVTNPSDLRYKLEFYLDRDFPPESVTAQNAILTVWERLRELETAKTAELRTYSYHHHSDGYASERSLWQSINQYLTDVPGIKKPGRGRYKYTGDETVYEQLSMPE